MIVESALPGLAPKARPIRRFRRGWGTKGGSQALCTANSRRHRRGQSREFQNLFRARAVLTLQYKDFRLLGFFQGYFASLHSTQYPAPMGVPRPQANDFLVPSDRRKTAMASLSPTTAPISTSAGRSRLGWPGDGHDHRLDRRIGNRARRRTPGDRGDRTRLRGSEHREWYGPKRISAHRQLGGISLLSRERLQVADLYPFGNARDIGRAGYPALSRSPLATRVARRPLRLGRKAAPNG